MHSRHAISFAGATVFAAAALAGNPAPPPGPVAGTMKTLDEVEPRIPISQETAPGTLEATYWISAPGSYYLTGNLAGETDKIGIVVDAPDVTIDLMGFTMTGAPLVSLAWPAVYANNGASNVEVRNGSIVEWSGGGVFFDSDPFSSDNRSATARNLSIRDCTGWGIVGEYDTMVVNCRITRCLYGGINLEKPRGLIVDSILTDNDGPGIDAGAETVIRNCVATLNGGSGIIVGGASIVTGCNASINGLAGIGSGFEFGTGTVAENCTASFNDIGFSFNGAGIFTNCVSRDNNGRGYDDESSSTDNNGAVFSACVAESNDAEGFVLSNAAKMSDCTSTENTGAGVTAGDGLDMQDCVIEDNDAGGATGGAGSSVSGCIVRNNTGATAGLALGAESAVRDCEITGNAGNGLECGNGGLIESSVITQNGEHGASISSRTRIDGCTVRSNADSGIYSNQFCLITNNLVNGNGNAVGEAGIRVYEGARVEGNTLGSNFRGVRMDDNRNVVVRNTFILNGSPQLEDVNANNQNAPAPVGVATAGPWDNISH